MILGIGRYPAMPSGLDPREQSIEHPGIHGAGKAGPSIKILLSDAY
jgi:hypothetical protein